MKHYLLIISTAILFGSCSNLQEEIGPISNETKSFVFNETHKSELPKSQLEKFVQEFRNIQPLYHLYPWKSSDPQFNQRDMGYYVWKRDVTNKRQYTIDNKGNIIDCHTDHGSKIIHYFHEFKGNNKVVYKDKLPLYSVYFLSNNTLWMIEQESHKEGNGHGVPYDEITLNGKVIGMAGPEPRSYNFILEKILNNLYQIEEEVSL